MPPLLEDPRIRQNWNQFSSNAESAAENAAAGIWTFTHSYISPCFASVSNSVRECTGTCFPERDRRQRERGRSYTGRAERSFDFYDDWDDDLQNSGNGGGGILGWGNDELDRLLAGSGSSESSQPGRRRGMSYGARGGGRPKRKGTIDGLPDPTIIPSTSAIGFLGRLPFKLGRTLRYKPSAADLKEHPGALKRDLQTEEGQPLIADDEDFVQAASRKRSSTTGSGDTSDTFRSRGDLFPSDGEEDAVPLDDEFAMVLERRTTLGSGTDDRSSGRTKSSKGKKPVDSAQMSRTQSDNTQSSIRPSMRRSRRSSVSEITGSILSPPEMPTLTDLQQEEDDIRREEEEEIERKRSAAQLLARVRGLSLSMENEVKEETSIMEQQDIITEPPPPTHTEVQEPESDIALPASPHISPGSSPKSTSNTTSFVPARLPHF